MHIIGSIKFPSFITVLKTSSIASSRERWHQLSALFFIDVYIAWKFRPSLLEAIGL